MFEGVLLVEGSLESLGVFQAKCLTQTVGMLLLITGPHRVDMQSV